jgi:hypothetical protein
MSLITITPVNKPFTRNDLTITTEVEDKFKNGIYIASSSSYGSANNLAYNAFNGSTTKFWESGSTSGDSKPIYAQDPYTNSSPASYIGGGVPTNTFKTKLGGSSIDGEWIQIQIPYKIFIDSYGILPRQDGKSDQFPRKFCLVGSNDGITWEIIDQQVNPKPSTDTTKQTKFSVTTIYSYTYFRFIISEMTKGTTASLCQLNLYGYLNLISNDVYVDNGFVYSTGGTVFYNGGNNSILYSEKGTSNAITSSLYSSNGPVNAPGANSVSTNGGSINATQSNVTSTGGSLTASNSNISSTGSQISANNGTINSTGGSVTSSGGTLNSYGGSISSTGGTFNSTVGPIQSAGGTIMSTNGTISSTNDNIYANGGTINNISNSKVVPVPVPTPVPVPNPVPIPTPSQSSGIGRTPTPSTSPSQSGPVPKPPRQTPVIQNGNFSSPGLPGNYYKYINDSTTVPNWKFNAALLNTSNAWGYPIPYPSGNQCASIQSTQSISQSLVLSAGKCKVTGSACGRNCCASGTNPIDVYFNGNKIGTITSQVNKWETFTYSFTVPSDGTFEIKFQGVAQNDRSTALQNISVSNVEGFTTMSENKSSDLYISNTIKPFSMVEQSYGSFSITENFDSNVFVPTDVLKKTYGSTQTPEYIDAIKEYQLKPLNNLIKQNSEMTGNVNVAHYELRDKINPYLKERNKLLADKKIDYASDSPLYKDRKPTLADGLQEDIHTMIIKENNLYILGTITLATLLVGIIVIARN